MRAFLSEASNLKSFYVEPEGGCLIPCSLYERESHLIAEMLRRLTLHENMINILNFHFHCISYTI
jgi:hypothetical protein